MDLTSHQLLDILPTRNKEDVTAWLKQYPEIQVVSRDGSKTYAKAIKAACCDIEQVGDRWHILKQLFDAVKKTIYDYVPSRWIPPEKNPHSSNQEQNQEPFLRKTDLIRIQNEEKRWKRIQAVQEMASQNYSIAAIARLINISRNTVYQDLKTFQKRFKNLLINGNLFMMNTGRLFAHSFKKNRKPSILKPHAGLVVIKAPLLL